MLVWEAPDEPLWNNWWRLHLHHGKHKKAMQAAIEEANASLQPRLQELLDRSNNLHNRGLLAKADDLREAFWSSAGKLAPPADMRWSDAAQRAAEYGDALTRGFALVKNLDPRSIRWINHAPRNSIASLRHYNREVDMAGCDIYPVPLRPSSGHSDLVNQQLSSVGVYTRRMAAAAPGKAVAMVLQGFSWADIGQDKQNGEARPTLRQTRFMAYDAVLHGAAAVMWWGTYKIPKDGTLWRDILATARELRALEPALVAPPVKARLQCQADETWSSHDGQGPALILRRVGRDFVLVAVNETSHGLSFHLRGLPEALNGRILYRLGTMQSHVVRDGLLSDGIAPFDVHVYATSRQFEAGASIPAQKQRIETPIHRSTDNTNVSMT